MASAVDTQKIQSRQFIHLYDHDPGATTAVIVSPDGGTTIRTVDMSLFTRFFVQAMATIIGGGGLTLLEIIASAASDMSSAVVVKTSGTIAADAVGDVANLECDVKELAALGSDLRYVAARLTMATATDEAAVVYIAEAGRFNYEDLTPDTDIS